LTEISQNIVGIKIRVMQQKNTENQLKNMELQFIIENHLNY